MLAAKRIGPVLLVVLVFVLLAGWGLFAARTAYAAEDVSTHIAWQSVALGSMDSQNTWAKIAESGASGIDFSSGATYTLKITWKADDTPIFAGDYFTFTVPREFANAFLQPVEIYKSDQYRLYNPADDPALGGAVIDNSDAGYGPCLIRATFDTRVEGEADVEGTLLFGCRYFAGTPGPLQWGFTYNGTNYSFSGQSKHGEAYETVSIAASGSYGLFKGQPDNCWSVTLNQRLSKWTGAVTLSAAFGGGCSLDTAQHHGGEAGTCQWLESWAQNEEFFLAGSNPDYSDHAYFQAYVVDWSKMRQDYNSAHPSQQLGATETNSAMEAMLWDTYAGGAYKYLSSASSLISEITVTGDGTGFDITFTSSALRDKSVQVVCWYKAQGPPQQLSSRVAVTNNAALDLAYVGTVGLWGGNTAGVSNINLVKGKIGLEQRDADNNSPLADIDFSLRKDNDSYISSLRTDAQGRLLFSLPASGSRAGSYILSGTSLQGYQPLPDIRLEIGEDGCILQVSGSTLYAVDSNQRGLTVYAKKEIPPAPDKKDSNNNNSKNYNNDDNSDNINYTNNTNNTTDIELSTNINNTNINTINVNTINTDTNSLDEPVIETTQPDIEILPEPAPIISAPQPTRANGVLEPVAEGDSEKIAVAAAVPDAEEATPQPLPEDDISAQPLPQSEPESESQSGRGLIAALVGVAAAVGLGVPVAARLRKIRRSK